MTKYPGFILKEGEACSKRASIIPVMVLGVLLLLADYFYCLAKITIL